MKNNYWSFLFFLIFLQINFLPAQTPALNFDGIDDFVLTTSEGISGSADRTVEARIRTTTICDPNQGGIQNVIVDWGVFIMGQRFTFNVLWNNAIRLEVGGNGVSGNIAVNDGEWHHVAVAFFEEADLVKLYVDGVLDVEGSLTVSANTADDNNVVIGRRIDDTRYFQGDIDEVRIYNYGKTQAEIAADMNHELCEIPAGLVGYWKLNEGIPNGSNSNNNIVTDYSGNGNDGLLSNFALDGNTSNWVLGNLDSFGLVSVNETVTACDSAFVNGEWFSTSQEISYTTNNGMACDSMITVAIDITTINTEITEANDTLTAAESGADNYTWVECNTQTPVQSGTSSSFSPTENGDYAVYIELNNCEAISECISVIGLNTRHISFSNAVSIFPNPNNGQFRVHLSPNEEATDYSIYNSLGQLVRQKKISGNSFSIADTFEAGLKLIIINTNEGRFLQQFLVN